jgi:hypothetical protein
MLAKFLKNNLRFNPEADSEKLNVHKVRITPLPRASYPNGKYIYI